MQLPDFAKLAHPLNLPGPDYYAEHLEFNSTATGNEHSAKGSVCVNTLVTHPSVTLVTHFVSQLHNCGLQHTEDDKFSPLAATTPVFGSREVCFAFYCSEVRLVRGCVAVKTSRALTHVWTPTPAG